MADVIPHGTPMVKTEGGSYRPARPDETATCMLVGDFDLNVPLLTVLTEEGGTVYTDPYVNLLPIKKH